MGKKESIGTVEWLLKTRKYTEKERNQIIDLTNKQWNTIYDKTERKFKHKVFTCPLIGVAFNNFYVVVPDPEEENYAM